MAQLISILMPVFNAQGYLRLALESVLAQTLPYFEVVVIDDGSTDESPTILRELAGRDSRMRVWRQDNQGIVAALNTGLGLARGEYVARMDADDIAVPQRLERQMAYMSARSDCVAVGSQVIFIDRDGDEIGPKPDLKESHAEIDAALMAGAWPMVHPAVMMRTAVVRGIGGYRDFKTWEDHDLFLRLAEAGQLVNLKEPLLRYRLHLGSVVHQRMDSKATVLAEVLQDARRRRGLSAMAERELPVYRELTPAEHERNWVWWALAGGNAKAARKHARGALRKAPMNRESWRALYCAMRGR